MESNGRNKKGQFSKGNQFAKNRGQKHREMFRELFEANFEKAQQAMEKLEKDPYQFLNFFFKLAKFVVPEYKALDNEQGQSIGTTIINYIPAKGNEDGEINPEDLNPFPEQI